VDPLTIGPYTVVGRLGSGGMGRVHLAGDGRDGQVAVKMIRSDLSRRRRAGRRRDRDAAGGRPGGAGPLRRRHRREPRRPHAVGDGTRQNTS
jgi:serine/threonine protein kinase